MDFESPDVEKDFPGLYASESRSKNQDKDSDFSGDEKAHKKDLLIGKRKDKKDSKKDKGYVAFEGESSDDNVEETKSSKHKKSKSFKFPKLDKKKKSKCKEKKPEKKGEEKPVFGVPLHSAVERSKGHDGIELPLVVRECIDYIEEHGLSCSGIYKTSEVKSKVRQLREEYNSGNTQVCLFEYEPRIVASLLKQYLRDLPHHILTNELAPRFEEAAGISPEEKKVEVFKQLLISLPTCNRLLISWLMVHMVHVTNLSHSNHMTVQNISAVMGPVLRLPHSVLSAFFKHHATLFQDTVIKKYTVEPQEGASLPATPAAIAEELAQREAQLSRLHAELSRGLRDPAKEEQLWEVQRVVTLLKRKLRFLKQVASSEAVAAGDSTIDTRLQEPPPPQPQHSTPSPSQPQHSTPPPPQPQHLTPLLSQLQLSTTPPPGESAPAQPETATTDPKPPIGEAKEEPEEVKEPLQEESQPTATPTPLESSSEEEAEEIRRLLEEERRLLLEQEELCLLGEELRRKITMERREIQRLHMDIADYSHIYKYHQYSFDSSENSSDSDSTTEDHQQELDQLLRENQVLERKNAELLQQIQQERERCIQVKVEMKLLQMPPICPA